MSAAGAPPGPAGPEAEPSRRALLANLALGGAALGGVGHLLAYGCALTPSHLDDPPTKRRLVPPARVPEGVMFLREERLFLLREGARLRALSAVCTHLGCTVERGEAGFRCPCHGSEFGPDGGAKAGPAPRGLPWRPLTLGPDGNLVVDLAGDVGPDVALVLEGG